MALQPNAGRDIETDGPKVVRCPGCGQERWHGYGSCSKCGAPGTAAETDMVCLYFGTPEECQSCGGWTGAEDGPFEGDRRFCSEDCFIDNQEFVERQRQARETNWCPDCGFDNWEHAETCRRVAEARGLTGRAD
jgi:hypothetical protein